MRKTKRKWVFGLLALFGVHPALAQNARVSLSLYDMIRAADENSAKLQAARWDMKAAQSEADSWYAAEFPRLGLTGTYFYQTNVPLLTVNPKIPGIPFGTHDNWDAYAVLSWDVWDFRSQHNLSNSAHAIFKSREQAYDATDRQLKLAVRLAYFQVQINLEQARLLGNSLKVAQAQYADIAHQARFGTASRMDLLSSHQEVLNYERQFRQAQANLAESLRDLFDLVGRKEPADLTFPMDARLEGNLPEGISEPTVWVTLDSEKDSRQSLEKESAVPPDDSVPQLKTYAFLAESARAASDAVRSQLLPRITLNAQAGYQNPMGPIVETIQQNTVGITATMPLFDWGQIIRDSDSKREQSEAYLKNLDQARCDLERDWNKAQDALRSLKYQESPNQKAVSETGELAQLTYSSYRAGRARFLEVQTANFQALGAQVQAVSNEIQMLMQLSILSSLTG